MNGLFLECHPDPIDAKMAYNIGAGMVRFLSAKRLVVGRDMRTMAPEIQDAVIQGMLEQAHFHLFAMGMLLMTLTHLLLFVPLPQGLKATLIVFAFTGGLVNEGSGWLVRFASPRFAYLKIAGFLTLQTSLLVLMVAAAWALLTRAPSAYTQPFTPPRGGDPAE